MKLSMDSCRLGAVGLGRLLVAFMVVLVGVTGFAGASAASEYAPTDRELLEAVISQTGPAADAAGVSASSLASATDYKQMRESSATIAIELESSDVVAEAIDGLRSGDPIVVDRSITTIKAEAQAVADRMHADGGIDQLFGSVVSGARNSLLCRWWNRWCRPGCQWYSGINCARTFWSGNGNGSSEGLQREEAIADMTAAWAAR